MANLTPEERQKRLAELKAKQRPAVPATAKPYVPGAPPKAHAGRAKSAYLGDDEMSLPPGKPADET